MEPKSTPQDTPGGKLPTSEKALQAGASAVQDFTPLKSICGHLNAIHAYASDTSRFVETNHYCGPLNNDVRQCILYDSAEPNARMIGIEYMIAPHLYADLPQSERKYWHSHVFEVKSGMLIMPQSRLPEAAWEAAEQKEMEQIIQLYGKIYHLWQVDRGDTLPIGEPQLMTSLVHGGEGRVLEELRTRDERFGVDTEKKKAGRQHMTEPEIHPDADQAWKK